MKKKLTFLGIETSCDETAAAVVQLDSNGKAKVEYQKKRWGEAGNTKQAVIFQSYTPLNQLTIK